MFDREFSPRVWACEDILVAIFLDLRFSVSGLIVLLCGEVDASVLNAILSLRSVYWVEFIFVGISLYSFYFRLTIID